MMKELIEHLSLLYKGNFFHGPIVNTYGKGEILSYQIQFISREKNINFKVKYDSLTVAWTQAINTLIKIKL